MSVQKFTGGRRAAIELVPSEENDYGMGSGMLSVIVYFSIAYESFQPTGRPPTLNHSHKHAMILLRRLLLLDRHSYHPKGGKSLMKGRAVPLL
jgi:hypothetical protein